MSSTPGGASALRAADAATHLAKQLELFLLGMEETSDILQFLADRSAAYAAAPGVAPMDAATLDSISALLLAGGQAKPASATPGDEALLTDKHLHSHAEMYLTASEWEMLRSLQVTVPIKAQQALDIPN